MSQKRGVTQQVSLIETPPTPGRTKSAVTLEPAEPGHDPRVRPTRRRKFLLAIYYILPALVIVALFVAHRVISNQNREEVFRDTEFYEKWRVQHGTRSIYTFYKATDGKIVQNGPFVYKFTLQKENVTITEEKTAHFQLVREWGVETGDLGRISKEEVFKAHPELFPKLDSSENLGGYTVSGLRSTFNNIILPNQYQELTLGEVYLPPKAKKMKPYLIYIPDIHLVSVHDRLVVDSENEERITLVSECLDDLSESCQKQTNSEDGKTVLTFPYFYGLGRDFGTGLQAKKSLHASQLVLDNLLPVRRNTRLQVNLRDGESLVPLFWYEDHFAYQ